MAPAVVSDCGPGRFRHPVRFALDPRAARVTRTILVFLRAIVLTHAVGQVSPLKYPNIRGPMGARAVASFVVLVFANLPSVVSAQSLCPGIHVSILNIKNSTGTVACALFESPDGFPTEFLRAATNVMLIKVRKAQARCDFEDIPSGTYAIAVIHDENMNGKLDTNWLGIPKEGYGFSRDAKSVVRVPSFSAASFPYDGRNLDLAVRLHY